MIVRGRVLQTELSSNLVDHTVENNNSIKIASTRSTLIEIEIEIINFKI